MVLLTKKPFALLDVNKNPLLYAVLKRTFYNHFCAGENRTEVTSTIRNIKDIGFKGVILTYAREIVVDERSKQERGLGMQEIARSETDNGLAEKEKFADVEAWRSGVLDTLEMVGEGDFLALKFTGAGPTVAEALRGNKPLPQPMQDALDTICRRALQRNVRILVDAEQQSVQPAIDAIALKLMSEHNRGSMATVYNTYQMYLKSSIGTLDRHMREAGRDGHILGVKIVRGAYMNSEPRELIHDSKNDTDAAYNNSVKAMLQASYVDTSKDVDAKPPAIDLFIASHNKESALTALECHQDRLAQGLPTVNKIAYGQLLGMADEVSCGLLLKGKGIAVDSKGDAPKATGPEVYKCLSWGTLEDCLSYLVRRAVENKDAVTRTKSEQIMTRRELWRRSKAIFGMNA